jgi:hypothetical protein
LLSALDGALQTAHAHTDALRTFENAFLSATKELEQERDSLARERTRLEEERFAMNYDREQQDLHRQRDDGGMPQEDGGRFDADEDQKESFEMARDYAEDLEENPGQELEYQEEPHDVDLPYMDSQEGFDDRGVAERGRSRSRSPKRQRRPSGVPSSGVAQKVSSLILKLNLDENAARQVQHFPPEQALKMLEQVGEGVRNPSAFVTKMCSRTAHGDLSADYDRVDSRVEEGIERIRLDESAKRALQQLPAVEALNILDQIGDEVRNPSAFIMSMTNRVAKGGNSRSSSTNANDRVQAGIKRLNLDATASKMLQELPTDTALGILDHCGDDVRNPSAFVTAEVRKIQSKGGGSGYDGARGRESSHNPRDFERQLERLARDLDLDGDCVDALRSISMQESISILERLASDLSTIRNRSAFVFAEVKKRRATTPPPSARERAGGSGNTKGVSCKFHAEGRCNKGSDCRFSHE